MLTKLCKMSPVEIANLVQTLKQKQIIVTARVITAYIVKQANLQQNRQRSACFYS